MRKTISLIAITGIAIGAVTGPSTAQDQAKVDFAKDVYPFLKNSCVQCHKPAYEDERGRMRKPKAGLVVTNKEAFLKGAEGEEEGQWEAVIVPGKPKESNFYMATTLPLEHDEHMPPEDKADQLTEEQQKTLALWIEQGADFGDWVEDPEFKE